MKKTFFAAAVLAASALSALEPPKDTPLQELLEAERNFAMASAMKGRNAAFVDNLAEECLVFNESWLTKGRQFFRDQKQGPIVLKWEPEFLDVSDGGDFGVTTGPWEVQEYRPGTEPLMEGYFLSVWRKMADGEWKVILDDGIIMPVAAEGRHQVSFPEGAGRQAGGTRPADAEALAKTLKELDKKFLSEWKEGPVAVTYAGWLSPGARVMRSGTALATGEEKIKNLLDRESRKLDWTPVGSAAAPSGDLGFTYGSFVTQAKNEPLAGHYVRIWKRQPDGSFKILIDMLGSD